MEFLYRLYSNSYFGIGLFIVMTVLVFSFLVILFFGKKDEKARNKEEKIIESPEEVKSEEIKIPIEEDLKIESLSNMTLENNEEEKIEDIPTSSLKEDIIEPTTDQESISAIDEDFEDDRDDIFSFNSSLDNVEKETMEDEFSVEKNDYDNIFEKDIKQDDDIFRDAPVIEETEENNIFTEESKIDEMPVRKQSSSPIFSSVYLNGGKKKEENKETEDVNVRPTPRKPEFELPKKIEFPKLNEENQDDSINSIFSHLEDETYNIDKK